MNPKNFGNRRPEDKIAAKIDELLIGRGWLVKVITGNVYQSGLPDRYITHRSYGGRWVEYKYAEKFSFTPAQWDFFPKMLNSGTGIWVLTDATEGEYQKLFLPPNVGQYLGRTRKPPGEQRG